MFTGAIQYRSRNRKLAPPRTQPARSKAVASAYSEHLKKYLYNSTLHGLRYVGEATISIFERYYI